MKFEKETYDALVKLKTTGWKGEVRRSILHGVTQALAGTRVHGSQLDAVLDKLEDDSKITTRRKTTGRRETYIDLI